VPVDDNIPHALTFKLDQLVGAGQLHIPKHSSNGFDTINFLKTFLIPGDRRNILLLAFRGLGALMTWSSLSRS
jgi:hypothetical protein